MNSNNLIYSDNAIKFSSKDSPGRGKSKKNVQMNFEQAKQMPDITISPISDAEHNQVQFSKKSTIQRFLTLKDA